MKKPHKLGVVSSGGSTKGAYQAGVYVALDERGILGKATYFAGTSVGALNSAALTSIGPKTLADIYLTKIRKTSDVFKFRPTLGGLFTLDPVMKLMLDNIQSSNPRGIEAEVVTVDLGQTHYPIRYSSNKYTLFPKWLEYVRASATIPGLVRPKYSLGEVFDGGLREYAPLERALEKCNNVIAIATSPILNPAKKKQKLKFPKIITRIINSFDGVLTDVNENDFRVCAKKHMITIICPHYDLNVGVLEASPSTMRRIYEEGYNNGKRAAVNMKVGG